MRQCCDDDSPGPRGWSDCYCSCASNQTDVRDHCQIVTATRPLEASSYWLTNGVSYAEFYMRTSFCSKSLEPRMVTATPREASQATGTYAVGNVAHFVATSWLLQCLRANPTERPSMSARYGGHLACAARESQLLASEPAGGGTALAGCACKSA